jgi:protein-S-isoprenylcysteine O-methyltransferase Ste14
MNFSLALSVVIALVGLGFYLWNNHPKYSTAGLVAFGCGLLATLLRLSGGVAINVFKG